MKKIGLLGGSFDLAHFGHLAISLFCLQNLGFDKIIWVVSKNPMKFSIRNDDKLKLSIIDSIIDLHEEISVVFSDDIHTIDIINSFVSADSYNKYFWIMGIDSYLTLKQWKNYEEIVNLIPMVVFNRKLEIGMQKDFTDLILHNALENGQKIFSDFSLFMKQKNYSVYPVQNILCDLSSTAICC